MTHLDSTARVFVRAARAEFTRLVSVRSTWWCLSAAVALMLFIGGMAGADHVAGEAAPIWMPAQVALVPAQFLFVMVAMLAVTGEYASGNIHSSLQWVPRRRVFLAARVTVPVVAVTVVAVLGAALAALVVWAFVGSEAEVVVPDIAVSLGRAALVVGFGSVLAVERSVRETTEHYVADPFRLPLECDPTGPRFVIDAEIHCRVSVRSTRRSVSWVRWIDRRWM